MSHSVINEFQNSEILISHSSPLKTAQCIEAQNLKGLAHRLRHLSVHNTNNENFSRNMTTGDPLNPSEENDYEFQGTMSESDVDVQFNKQVPVLEDHKLIFESAPHVQESSLTKPRMIGVFEFIWMELTRGYSLQNEEDRYTEKRRKVYAFLMIPIELEKFLFYGFLQCLCAFCHIFTFLPIRIFINLFGCCLWLKSWSAADTCDILKALIIIVSSVFMQFIDTSMIYHLVRGQGVIKLYIFYNMLEVADKLFSSFGQDIFDALLWTVSERGGKRKFLSTLFHLTVAIVYAISHTVLVLLQATTLNVAFNSHNQSLLTIMMSNNFVELKGSVFKKFAKPNLFQMSCSDVRERFHTVVLLVVVVLRNMTAMSWKIEHLYEMLPDLILIIVAELIVDWLKHAFITKFNEIPADVYQDFTVTLAFDVLRSHEDGRFSDFSDQVSRRMGFIPIPITILLIRIVTQSVDFFDTFSISILVSIWVFLLMTKVLCGVYLHGKAVAQIIEYQKKQAALLTIEDDEDESCKAYRKRFISKSVPSSPRLSFYDFTDVLTQAATRKFSLRAAAPLLRPSTTSGIRHRRRRRSSSGNLPQHESLVDGMVPEDQLLGTNQGSSTPPRRCQSMGNFIGTVKKEEQKESVNVRNRHDSTLTSTPTREFNADDRESMPNVTCNGPNSPYLSNLSNKRRRRVVLQAPASPIQDLDDVQAYTLLASSSTASLVTTVENDISSSQTPITIKIEEKQTTTSGKMSSETN